MVGVHGNGQQELWEQETHQGEVRGDRVRLQGREVRERSRRSEEDQQPGGRRRRSLEWPRGSDHLLLLGGELWVGARLVEQLILPSEIIKGIGYIYLLFTIKLLNYYFK